MVSYNRNYLDFVDELSGESSSPQFMPEIGLTSKLRGRLRKDLEVCKRKANEKSDCYHYMCMFLAGNAEGPLLRIAINMTVINSIQITLRTCFLNFLLLPFGVSNSWCLSVPVGRSGYLINENGMHGTERVDMCTRDISVHIPSKFSERRH